jgi:hypothetical protein
VTPRVTNLLDVPPGSAGRASSLLPGRPAAGDSPGGASAVEADGRPREGLRRVRFGVLCNGTTFPAWQARALRSLLDVEGVECALLVVNGEPPRPSPLREKVARVLRVRGLLWTLFQRFCVERWSRARHPVDLSEDLADVPTLECSVERRGPWSEHFREGDVAAIRTHDLDFLLRFGFGILRGEILTAARHGVWSFHHDDLRRYRGGPPGFWEIYRGDPMSGAVLQRLTERLDGGVVLAKGTFRTIPDSYVRSRDAALMGGADWPARVCRDLQRGRADYLDAPPATTDAPVFRAPTNLQMLVFLARTLRAQVRHQVGSLFRGVQWNIGVLRRPIGSLVGRATVDDAEWLPSPARRWFAADPFGVTRQGRTFVFFERYDYRSQRGHLACVEVDGGRPLSDARTVSETVGHLSYPFVLEEDGATYCVPEAVATREVALWRIDDFPGGWTKVATLVPDFPGADPTIVRHDGRWWLFCTDHDTGAAANLHVFWAEALFGPYRPHARNPVKTDARSARAAGTPFVEEGVLYRPAQDGSGEYGGAVVLHRVVRLTPEEFEEEPVTRVAPDASGPLPGGLHTVSGVGDVTLIDGRRSVFVPWLFVHGMRSKTGKLMSVVTGPFAMLRRLAARPRA